MGKWRWVAGVLIGLLALSAQAGHEANEPSDGTVASFIPVEPPRALESVAFYEDGLHPRQLSDYRGKLLLVNVWATWCPPCIRELPALDRMQARLGSDRFQVLAIATDEEGAKVVRPYFEELKIESLGIYTSTAEELGKTFPVDVYPASFFIDPQGRVLSFLRSIADWDAPEADQMVQDYLAKYPPEQALSGN